MSDILWRRLKYMLTPQLDLYRSIAPHLDELRVVEVGFGTGFGTVQLARYAKYVDALESDGSAVQFAKQALPIRNVDYIHGSITDHLPHIQIDAVVMVEVLEHIADWERALLNVKSLLLPGGKLYITARNKNADLRRNDLHEREWTAQELQEALYQFFSEVRLYDYTLNQELDINTHITPLIAVAAKEYPRHGPGL